MPPPAGHHDERTDPSPHDAPPPGHAATTPPLPPTIGEVVDGVFSKFDADLDGSITQAEVLNVVDPTGRFTELVTRVTNLVSTIDGDADGALSKAELTTAVTALDTNQSGTLDAGEAPGHHAAADDISWLLRGHGPGPLAAEAASRPIAEVVADVFQRLDANDDAGISLSEMLGLLDAGNWPIDFTALATGLFTQIDSNADNVLSNDEVTAAVNLVDTNQDGTIGPGDLLPEQFDQQSVELIGLLVHGLGQAPHGCGE